MRQVECLKHTSPDLAELAARTCTATTEKCSPTIGGAVNFLKGLIDSGHESVIEHLVYTFSIKGVSRALLQELARHRHISLSVESTRWALKRIMDKDPEVNELVWPENEIPDYAKGKVEHVLITVSALLERGFPNDTVKYLLPECVPTNLVMTLNLRELRHIYRLRTDKRALKEFRDLMKDILESLPPYHRELLTHGIDKYK